MTDKLLTTAEAAQALGVSKAFLERDRWAGVNRHQFARHLSAIHNGYQRGAHEQQTLSRRIQD